MEDPDWLSPFLPRERDRVQAWLNGVLRNGSSDTLEVRGDSADQWLEIRAAPNDDPESGLVLIALDVSAQKWRESLLTFGAIHDPVTGLHNRIALLEHMELALAQMSREPSILAVLFVDLDRFKEVNDQHGHETGDRVLVEAAQRLKGAIRPADTLARVGGDEFVVLCPSLHRTEEARSIARRLTDSLEAPIRISRSTAVKVSATVGIAFANRSSEAPARIIDRADRAMYQAKRRGSTPSGADAPVVVEVQAPDHPRSDAGDAATDAVARLARLEAEFARRWADSLSRPADDTDRWQAACHHVEQALAALRGRIPDPDRPAARSPKERQHAARDSGG
jgi:diguanylate cyclase (GGDEF)-like protein